MRRILALLIFGASSIFGETIELLPVQDNSLYEPEIIDPENPSVNFSNGAGDYIFAGRTSVAGEGRTRRALVKFDLSGIPENATITSASLRLYLSNTIRNPEAKTVDVELRRLTRDWGEGSSDAPTQEGGGATVTEGDASWFHSFFTTTIWTTPGGDFEDLPTGIEAVGDKFLFYTWNGPGLTEDVQAWLEFPETNHGWIVISDESEIETAKRFDSRESFNFSSDFTPTKPLLTIEYTTDQIAPQERLVNVSTRALVKTGDEILIAGLVIGGNSPRRVLIQGLGPSLADNVESDVLEQPVISLARGSDIIATYDTWPEHQIAGILEANARTGASPILPESGDVAFIADLDPGLYTLLLYSKNESEGIALVEAYEIDRDSPDTGRFINISTRSFVSDGDNVMIAGFVIPPGPDRTLLIRGIGPELATQNVSNPLPDPQIHLFRDQSIVQHNDDWSGEEVIQATASVTDGQLPVGSKDAALVTTLPPGIYTVILSSVTDETGVALVEVYELP